MINKDTLCYDREYWECVEDDRCGGYRWNEDQINYYDGCR